MEPAALSDWPLRAHGPRARRAGPVDPAGRDGHGPRTRAAPRRVSMGPRHARRTLRRDGGGIQIKVHTQLLSAGITCVCVCECATFLSPGLLYLQWDRVGQKETVCVCVRFGRMRVRWVDWLRVWWGL